VQAFAQSGFGHLSPLPASGEGLGVGLVDAVHLSPYPLSVRGEGEKTNQEVNAQSPRVELVEPLLVHNYKEVVRVPEPRDG
jgi:hypothetical protein